MEDYTGDERTGFFVPVGRITTGIIILSDGVGLRCHIVDQIDVARIHRIERIVLGGGAARNAERVEAMHLTDNGRTTLLTLFDSMLDIICGCSQT